MSVVTKKEKQVLELIRKKGVLRARDLDAYGIPRTYLRTLYRKGLLMNPERGLYILADTHFGSHHTQISVGQKVPNGVMCLLSALAFHEMTTQLPSEVWIAVDNKAWQPQIKNLPVRLVRFSGKAFTEGVEYHTINGVRMKVYSAAKTVADCFKYRNKIGIDVAIEALQEYGRLEGYTMDDLWKYAKICRVTNVMRPYMEMLS
ncbi:MAG: type IV toxin-antitoxin system AbiEi family antitoxin domain-containing protein [Bdellovibrionota bacterium]